MKKIIVTSLFFTLLLTQANAIRQYKNLETKAQGIFNSLTAKDNTIEKFKETISSYYNYRLTDISNPNIAEKVLYKELKDTDQWFSIIFVYSILNEIEEQLASKTGKKLKRFKTILETAHKYIEQNEKLDQETLEKILYTNGNGKETFFKKYMSKLILRNKIITPSLITALHWLGLLLKTSIDAQDIDDVKKITNTAPYLVLVNEYIDGYKQNKNIKKIIDDTKKELSSIRATINYKQYGKNLCNMF